MTTVKEWLRELPDGYRERALAQCMNPEFIVDRLYQAIDYIIDWKHTIEGEDFWLDVWQYCLNGSPLPPLPQPLNVWELLAENTQLKARLQHLEDMVLNALEALQEKP